MHELGIAQKIVAAVENAAKKNNINRVASIRLRLGQMSATHPDQLKFGFDTYAKDSSLVKAKLVIEEVKVELECEKCRVRFGDKRFDDHEFAHTIAHAPVTYDPPKCPKCGTGRAKIIYGQEMELVDIEGD